MARRHSSRSLGITVTLSIATHEKRTAILTTLGFVMQPLIAENVPPSLREFIGVAEFWGLPEDGAIEELVDSASHEEVQVLFDTVRAMPDTLEGWLTTPPAPEEMSPEYIRFSCLVVAYEFAKLRLHLKDA
jgi:hypothetical protein